MKWTRRVVAVMAGILLMLVPMGVSAAPTRVAKAPIQPMWNNVDSAYATLSFNGSYAQVTGSIMGKSGTTQITTTLTLERKMSGGAYVSVKTWGPQTTQGEIATLSGSYNVPKGYTYRLTVRAQVTRGGVVETVSDQVLGDATS